MKLKALFAKSKKGFFLDSIKTLKILKYCTKQGVPCRAIVVGKTDNVLKVEFF
ncbi:hypothetical protein LEP1GSC074_1531 [Leptospira noguchii str. Hook]|nr:hypothetical protein LEP1GSC041_4444 [Leptospira noguchii str. 2006001870]EMS84144.1 hypothetical protein LEP1GSC074_1531 [Leptospira noguchii str. Hook]